MASAPGRRVRRSIADIQADYDAGNKKELEDLMRAWKGIKELGPNDFNAFFKIGGFHGEPFRGPGAQTSAWWGGYCQHGTVLFPTWHRAYLYRLEEALRRIPGCASVTMPFWDETSEWSRQNGIPRALTDETFPLDGKVIANPLRSFVLPATIVDAVTLPAPGDNNLYTKGEGYETVRYPLSGLVGTPEDRATTAAHNAQYPTPEIRTTLLNGNITRWLNTSFTIEQPQGPPRTVGLVYQKFVDCLDAPSYTLFSNTTSAGHWNGQKLGALVVALESPHNAIHLAVGGFDIPGQARFSPIRGANGDMGENDTAALDPIFHFHHCFIDYVFWIWQRRQGATNKFDIDPDDPGAKYDPDNPPPAGADPNATMSMTTPLEPFFKEYGVPFTTADLINIESQLGYAYGPGSLDGYADAPQPMALAAGAEPGQRTVHVAGIHRSKIRGSFLIATWADLEGEKQLIGIEPVLSRWHVSGCANCQTRLRVSADVPLPAGADPGSVAVEVHTRDGLLGTGPSRVSAGLLPAALAIAPPEQPFTVEIR
jgi:tyrosinase